MATTVSNPVGIAITVAFGAWSLVLGFCTQLIIDKLDTVADRQIRTEQELQKHVKLGAHSRADERIKANTKAIQDRITWQDRRYGSIEKRLDRLEGQ